MAKRKLSIEVKEVSWTNGKVNKYQAFASFTNPVTKKVGRRIIGDPATTKEEAMANLEKEANEWNTVSALFLDEMSKKQK